MIVRSIMGLYRQPSLYLLQIGNEPILAFEAISLNEARELAREKWLMEELRQKRSGGRPLWDGQAPLHIGRAVGEQVDEIHRLLLKAPQGEELQMVYLVKVDGNE